MALDTFFSQGLSPCLWTRPYWSGTSKRHGLTLLTDPALEPTVPPLGAPVGSLLVRVSTFPIAADSPAHALSLANSALVLETLGARVFDLETERVFFGGVWHPASPRWIRVATNPSPEIGALDTYAEIMAERRKGAVPVLIHKLRRI